MVCCTRCGWRGAPWRLSSPCRRRMHWQVCATSLVTMMVEASVTARVKLSLPACPATSARKSTSALTWPSRSKSKACRSTMLSTASRSLARPNW
ncbi:hypothetical protein D3C75_1156520 [compost metagenome]